MSRTSLRRTDRKSDWYFLRNVSRRKCAPGFPKVRAMATSAGNIRRDNSRLLPDSAKSKSYVTGEAVTMEYHGSGLTMVASHRRHITGLGHFPAGIALPDGDRRPCAARIFRTRVTRHVVNLFSVVIYANTCLHVASWAARVILIVYRAPN